VSLTRRQQLVRRLSAAPATVRDLAAELGLQIRQVVEDLEHIRRSLRSKREKELKMQPAECERCEMVFTDRQRFTAPSRCPRCRSERTTHPVLWIE
jgi:predicted Zn-ribbon and HTH transcriptional regulator